MDFAAINEAVRNDVGNPALLLIGIGPARRSACSSRSAPRRSRPGPPTSTRAPRPRSPRFMAAGTKVAAFGAMLRLFYVALRRRPLVVAADAVDHRDPHDVRRLRSLAITQTDIKRMLAYSSVAHTGFLLTGVLGAAGGRPTSPPARSPRSRRCSSTSSTYGFATIGAFAVVTLVRDAGGEADPPVPLGRLGKESPVVAGGLRVLPARHGRHPADLRASSASGRSSRSPLAAGRVAGRGRRDPGQHRRRLLLRPRHRADVLRRARPSEAPTVTLPVAC